MHIPTFRAVVAAVRSRIPGLAPPTQHDSPLPYVVRRPTVNPVLPVSDMDRAIAFYRRLGFVVNAYDAGYAWVKNCGWEIVHLAAADGDNSAGAYVHVEDADAWHVALGALAPEGAIGDLAVQPWGKREFPVTDPDGNVIRFGSPA